MLKIGEFSTLTGISIHMLRNYDKIGLLKPEQIDRMNNYRFLRRKADCPCKSYSGVKKPWLWSE